MLTCGHFLWCLCAQAMATPAFDSAGLYMEPIYKILCACIIIPQFLLLSMLLLSDNIHAVFLSGTQGAIIIFSLVVAFAMFYPHRHDMRRYPLYIASRIDASRTAAMQRERHNTAGDFGAGRSAAVSGPAAVAVASAGQTLRQPLVRKNDTDRPGHSMRSIMEYAGPRSAPLPVDPLVPRRRSNVVVIPPNMWRSTLFPASPVGDRTYLVPATAADILIANKHLLGLSKNELSSALASATFVYDYSAPTLRAARQAVTEIGELAPPMVPPPASTTATQQAIATTTGHEVNADHKTTRDGSPRGTRNGSFKPASSFSIQ